MRPSLLLVVAALFAVSAAFSFISGRAQFVYGIVAVIWLLLTVLFSRPRLRVASLWPIVVLLALAAVAVCVALPGLDLPFRLSRLSLVAACAVFLCTMEFAPRAHNLAWIALASYGFAVIVSAWYIEAPLLCAVGEQRTGAFIAEMYRNGTAKTPFSSLLLASASAHFFYVRNDRIYAKPTTYDVMHAMRMDDPAHIAALAKGLPPTTNPCAFIADPPAGGYVMPGYGKFQRQISSSCR